MLKRVSIQNFKSLKGVTLDLQKVNLLIGPNNSGKTNFLKALEFMSNLNEEQNELDINNLFEKNDDKNLLIDFIFDNLLPFIDEKYSHYRVSPQHKSFASFMRRYPEKKYGLVIGKADTNDLDSIHSDLAVEKPNTDNYKIQVDNIKYDSGHIIIYKPNPNKIDKPGPVGRGEDSIAADTSNLIAFFDRIRDEYPAAFAQIKADLSTCLPEFIEINFQNVEPTEDLVKQFGPGTFKRIGLTDGRQNVKYWADELSEGTLYFLALLCIINQPNPPKLLLLEEPEKGIHPRRIREVMDFIFRLSEEKDIQIILTTHNENVLNEFTSMPEAVFVFSKDEEGATQVKNLQTDIIELSHQRSRETNTKEIDFTTNLGENWMYGLLGGVPEESL